jgi:hypothetical protein
MGACINFQWLLSGSVGTLRVLHLEVHNGALPSSFFRALELEGLGRTVESLTYFGENDGKYARGPTLGQRLLQACPNATEIGLFASNENVYECIPFFPAGMTHLTLISDILYDHNWTPQSGEWLQNIHQLYESLRKGPNGPLQNLTKLALDVRAARSHQFDHSIADNLRKSCSIGGIDLEVFIQQIHPTEVFPTETGDTEEDGNFSDLSESVLVLDSSPASIDASII